MTDPDEFVGSPADRRFREELRRSLEAAAREEAGTDDAATRAPAAASENASAPENAPARGRTPATSRPAADERSGRDRFLDWAPLAVGLLAIVAIAGIVVYGMNGGDLGPW